MVNGGISPKSNRAPRALMRRTCWFNIYSEFSHEKMWFTHWAWWFYILLGGDWNHGILWLSHHIGNVIIPTDEVTFFRGVGLNHQPGGNVMSTQDSSSPGSTSWVPLSDTLWDWGSQTWFAGNFCISRWSCCKPPGKHWGISQSCWQRRVVTFRWLTIQIHSSRN